MLDWEHDLPEPFFSDSCAHSRAACLSVVLGSSLQIQPANKLPTYSKNTVIINLSKTKMDKKAQLIINAKCDVVMQKLMEKLDIKVPKWDAPLVVPKSIHPIVPIEEKPKGKKRKKNVKTEPELKKPA